MDGWMDGWKDECMRWIKGQMYGNGRTEGRIEEMKERRGRGRKEGRIAKKPRRKEERVEGRM